MTPKGKKHADRRDLQENIRVAGSQQSQSGNDPDCFQWPGINWSLRHTGEGGSKVSLRVDSEHPSAGAHLPLRMCTGHSKSDGHNSEH